MSAQQTVTKIVPGGLVKLRHEKPSNASWIWPRDYIIACAKTAPERKFEGLPSFGHYYEMDCHFIVDFAGKLMTEYDKGYDDSVYGMFENERCTTSIGDDVSVDYLSVYDYVDTMVLLMKEGYAYDEEKHILTKI